MNHELPPLINVPYKKLISKDYKKAVLDALEIEAHKQYFENLDKFQDFYDMYDGTLSSREIREYVPGFDKAFDLLEAIDMPTYLRHFDILGAIINALVGKFLAFQDKFHVTESGEVAENEFLDFKNQEITKMASEIISNAVKLGAAQQGINIDEGKQFESQEEEQQYQQQLQQIEQQFTPKIVKMLEEFPNFKTMGIEWGERLLERDGELLKFTEQYQELFKQYLLSGKCAKITKVVYDTYKTFVWDSREIFHSRDIGEVYLNNFQYVGRFHYKTPNQTVSEYGHFMNEAEKRAILGGDNRWKSLLGTAYNMESPGKAMRDNFHSKEWQPYPHFQDVQVARKMEDMTGLPMGLQYFPNNDSGEWETAPRFIPRGNYGNGTFSTYGANQIERRFKIREDVCQITECYIEVFEKVGWLTWEDEYGNRQTDVVTEDILKDFLKDNEIKQTIKVSYDEMIKEFEVDTLVWQSKPFTYQAIKVQGAYLEEPLYLKFDRMENQITDLSTFDNKRPVTGIVKTSLAAKISPHQEMFNFMMNSIRQIAETDVGMFDTIDVNSIPSQFMENGDDIEDAIMQMRNLAKRSKFLPIQTNPDNVSGGSSIYNQHQPVNLSDYQGIQWRTQIADRARMEAYGIIGINPGQALSAEKYVNAEGLKLSNESSNDQLAQIFGDFNNFIREDKIQHLNIAHWMQAQNLDKTMHYTNSYNQRIWLDMTNDPDFSFRRIGLTISDDARKRKEFESLKQYLLSQNTMGADALMLGKLISTDAFTELIQIATEERALAQQRAELDNQNKMAQIERQNQLMNESNELQWQREEASKDKDRENRLRAEEIKSLGRAVDNDADGRQVGIILDATKASIMATKEENRHAEELEKINIKQEELDRKKVGALGELSLKQRELDIREKAIEAKRIGDVINKN